MGATRLMLLFGGTVGLLMVAVWIFCVIDTITTPQTEVRNLPKLAWIFIVLLLLDVGAIAWLVAGRPWTKVPVGTPRSGGGLGGPAPRPGARPVARRATNPDDDEEFLASLAKRAEEQRRRARENGDGDQA